MKKLKKIVIVLLLVVTLFNPAIAFALEKQETVYINLGYDGKQTKTIVNNHLYIKTKGDIKDETELQKILNINGDEKFVLDKGILTWKANNKDIFYRGVTEKLTPIKVDIKYYLNEKEVKVKDILGKSGKIKIVMNFKNNMYVKSKGMYMPFVVTAGTVINATDNTNIEITNGKSVNTGTKNMVVGISSPGLYENMKIDEFKDLDSITISYDTKKFSLSNIYMVATPKLLEDTDLEIFDKMDELDSSIGTIQSSMNELEKGAKTLASGSQQLISGSSEISKNLKTVASAITSIKEGTVKVDEGLKQAIKELEAVEAELNKKGVSSDVLLELKSKNELAISNLSNVNKTLEQTYKNNSLGNFKTDAELISYLTNLGTLTSDQITSLVTCKKTYESNQSLILLLQTNNAVVSETVSSLTLLTQLKNGLVEIENGESLVNSGLSQVQDGINKLYKGSVTLSDGTKTLGSGINTLSGGISTLNNKGIKKLSSMTRKYKGYGDKIEQLILLSEEYKGFTSKNSSNTIFVYKVQSAK